MCLLDILGQIPLNFEIGDEKKLAQWKMFKESKSLEKVYEVALTQFYKGKYGWFEFVQYVFVTEKKGNWVILWEFNK
jgi:hypothetical protein